jgi:hypothetical protein
MKKLNITEDNTFTDGQEVSFDIKVETNVLIESDLMTINEMAENALIHNQNNVFLNEIDFTAIDVQDNIITLNINGTIFKG